MNSPLLPIVLVGIIVFVIIRIIVYATSEPKDYEPSFNEAAEDDELDNDVRM